MTHLIYGFRDKRPNLRKISAALYPEGSEIKTEKFGGMLSSSRAAVRAKKAEEIRGDNG